MPFRVNAVDEPPTAPTLVSPAEGAVLAVPRPALVVANATSPDQLTLTYDFELYVVSPVNGSLALVEAATGVASGPTETSWTPSDDLADGSYSWRARALDVNQAGPWMASAHFAIATDQPPAAPTGLAAVAGNTSVALSWNPNTEPDLTGYRVYRGTTSGGPYAFVTATTQTSLTDTGLVNGQPVYYVVTATDALYESPYSTEASATPHSGPLSVQVAFWPAVIEGRVPRVPGHAAACGAPLRSADARARMRPQGRGSRDDHGVLRLRQRDRIRDGGAGRTRQRLHARPLRTADSRSCSPAAAARSTRARSASRSRLPSSPGH